MLQFSDFEANQEQTQETLWTMRLINGGLPLVMYTLGALVLTRFDLNEREHAEIRAALDRRVLERR